RIRLPRGQLRPRAHPPRRTHPGRPGARGGESGPAEVKRRQVQRLSPVQYDDVVLGRRSIRGYKRQPVPKQVIREVIELAMRAPSSLNTQPWNFYVVTGAPLDLIRKGNTERNLAGVPDTREFRRGPGYEGPHRERQIEIAKQLFAAMGIERDNKEKRQ